MEKEASKQEFTPETDPFNYLYHLSERGIHSYRLEDGSVLTINKGLHPIHGVIQEIIIASLTSGGRKEEEERFLLTKDRVENADWDSLSYNKPRLAPDYPLPPYDAPITPRDETEERELHKKRQKSLAKGVSNIIKSGSIANATSTQSLG